MGSQFPEPPEGLRAWGFGVSGLQGAESLGSRDLACGASESGQVFLDGLVAEVEAHARPNPSFLHPTLKP